MAAGDKQHVPGYCEMDEGVMKAIEHVYQPYIIVVATYELDAIRVKKMQRRYADLVK